MPTRLIDARKIPTPKNLAWVKADPANPPPIAIGDWILIEVAGHVIPVESTDPASTVGTPIDWTTVTIWAALPA